MIEKMNPSIEKFIEPNATEIQRITTTDAGTFYKTYFHAKKPVIFTNIMHDWPATQKWSLKSLQNLTPKEQSLYIEEGDILRDITLFKKVQFGKYIESLLSEKNESNTKKPPYLADFNIFENFPELKNDVNFDLLSSNTVTQRINGWIGPAHTVSSYHVDWADNLFAQIEGRKLIKLISPEYNTCMYPSKKYDSGSLLSSIDSDNYDATKYPRFREAKSQYTVLNPGELLYIPYGWWHYIRALDPSISVNCFAWGWKGVCLDLPIRYIKKRLHAMKLYGRNGCSCHMIREGKRIARSMHY